MFDGSARSSSTDVPLAASIASIITAGHAGSAAGASSADGNPSCCSMRARIHHSSARSPIGSTIASVYWVVGTMAMPPPRRSARSSQSLAGST